MEKIKPTKYLREVYDAPKELYCMGEESCLKKICIAIVGTRKCTEYGEYMTRKIVEELSLLDVAIVSGLARGIDTIAHQAALENDIPTIAVLGSGLNNIYPKSNALLAEKITKNGLLISEYEPDTPPVKHNFPQRNRIISGISVATLIIEAPEKSGALITARFALEQGRDIFVVPGDADRKNSKGIIKLLQRGAAYPISSGQDITEQLKIQPHLFPEERTKQNTTKTPALYKFTEKEEWIIKNMFRRRAITLEELAQKCDLSTETILSTLSVLEIKGLISTKDGKYLRKC